MKKCRIQINSADSIENSGNFYTGQVAQAICLDRPSITVYLSILNITLIIERIMGIINKDARYISGQRHDESDQSCRHVFFVRE